MNNLEDITEITKQLGARIGALRLKRGLTLAQLATACGFPEEVLVQIEAGGRAPLRIGEISQCALKLGTTASALLDGIA